MKSKHVALCIVIMVVIYYSQQKAHEVKTRGLMYCHYCCRCGCHLLLSKQKEKDDAKKQRRELKEKEHGGGGSGELKGLLLPRQD
jgi:hypothetical protein